MGGAEAHTRHNTTQPSSRLGLLRTAMGGGEIVEVQGGHIVRSTGRKDRHSKVCTAKGPRDRRVRLSAHTAIQFYDVQDRLGYDRPSKAVDWLIKNAKPAIDELAELPPWRPTATTTAQSSDQAHQTQNQNQSSEEVEAIAAAAAAESGSSSGFGFQNPSNSGSSFLPPSLDSDAIADTIKSFFPMAAAAAANTSSSSVAFQNYSPELLSRTNSQSQDLRLSLHSFHDHHPIFPTSFAGSANWSEQQPPEMGRFSAGTGDYFFNSLPPPVQILQNQNQNAVFSSQRGPLQSSNSPQVRAWIDQPFVTADHHQISALHQSAALMPGIGFTSGSFAGFRIPARIQGEEEHDAANKPASASRH